MPVKDLPTALIRFKSNAASLKRYLSESSYLCRYAAIVNFSNVSILHGCPNKRIYYSVRVNSWNATTKQTCCRRQESVSTVHHKRASAWQITLSNAPTKFAQPIYEPWMMHVEKLFTIQINCFDIVKMIMTIIMVIILDVNDYNTKRENC